VEVTDSKAKAFQHILKTRIGHNEQLSKEVLDFMENQRKFKDGDSSNLIPLYEQVHQANVCVCCDRFICGTDELYWINKTTQTFHDEYEGKFCFFYYYDSYTLW
jgi:hypothetical protein